MIAVLAFLPLLLAALCAARALGLVRPAERWVFAATLGSATVLAAILALGAAGLLGRGALLGLALAAAAAIAFAAVRRDPAAARSGLAADVDAFARAARLLRHPEVAALALLALVAWAWVAVAVATLPPRSVDDLSHHLTPVLEIVARGRLALLPVDYRPWIAYPLDADLLFAWPMIADGGLRWVELPQAAAGLAGALAAFALARRAGAAPRTSAAAALVVALLPVTLRQAASCYTDLIIGAWFGALALGVVAWIEERTAGGLLLAGLAAGLLAGTKYNVLYAVLLLAAPAILAHRGARGRAALAFGVPAAVFAAPWLLRNLVVLGNPFYPYRVGLGPVTLFKSAIVGDTLAFESPPFLLDVLRDPGKLAHLLLGDPGGGGIDGGLGPLFWGAALPAACVALVLALRAAWRKRTLAPLALPLAFAAGLVPYLASHGLHYDLTPRFLVAAAIPAFALLAAALERFRADWPAGASGACAGAALVTAFTLLPLGGITDRFERKQIMRPGPPAAHARQGDATPWRALAASEYGVQRHAYAWEMLDRLTAPGPDAPRGLWIYATGAYPAGLYGSALQNRIWNFGAPARPAVPDLFFYYFGFQGEPEKTEYYGDGRTAYAFEKVSLQADRFDMVYCTPQVAIYVRRELLAAGSPWRARLARYYETAEREGMTLARSLGRAPAGTIVAPPPAGYGFKALELRGELPGRAVLARFEQRDDVARTLAGTGPVFVAARTLEGLRLPVAGRMEAGHGEWRLHAWGTEP